MRGDGNGLVTGSDGTRRWGKFGAAGLLLRCPDPKRPLRPLVLMQHRAAWTNNGDTWALPGGARDSHESNPVAAVREAVEETGIEPERVTVISALPTAAMTDADGCEVWRYTTVVAECRAELPLQANEESLELRWVPEDDVAELNLMAAFETSWAQSLQTIPVRLILDVANIVGSKPNGWWKDRAGAAKKLLDSLAIDMPRTFPLEDGRFGWVGHVDAIVEGQARNIEHQHWFTVHSAPRSGDEVIVAVVEDLIDAAEVAEVAEKIVVVTADRGLRARLPSEVHTVGPRAVYPINCNRGEQPNSDEKR